MGPKRGPLSLVSTVEELLERKSSSCDLENRIMAIEIRRIDHATPLYAQKLVITSLTSGGCSWTKATELLLLLLLLYSLFLYARPL
jgi:hypothetical protein